MSFESQSTISKFVRKFDNVKLTAVVDYYQLGWDTVTKFPPAAASMPEGMMGPGSPGTRYDYRAPAQDLSRERLRFSLGAEITRPTVIYDTVGITGYWQDTRSSVASGETTRVTSFKTIAGTVTNLDVYDRVRANTLKHETEIRGINSIARKQIAGKSVSNTIQYGVETSFSDNTMSFNRFEDRFETDGTLRSSALQSPTFVMTPSSVYRAGVFASDKIEIGERKQYVITPSLRVDYYNVNPENTAEYISYTHAKAASFVNTSVSPGLSALYKITSDINVYGLYAMGTRNPTAGELNGIFNHSGSGMGSADQIMIVPNPSLKEEVANNFELGVQGNTERHAFRLAAFYNIYDNFIETDVPTGEIRDNYSIYTSTNLDNVTIYGIEASWHWSVDKKLVGGVDGFQFGVTFAWTNGRQDTEIGRQAVDSVDPWKIIAYIGYVDPADIWGVRLSGTFVAEKT
ncbi:MAG: TonB-dependent receptor, partial [Puniceicoccales bacterium]|nr:TonB-dependent receptor [Puniceicoccales bacterium]